MMLLYRFQITDKENKFSVINQKLSELIFPFLISLLFLSHPIHSEVVANIKSRDEIFCFLFLISTLITLYYYLLKGEKALYAISIFFYFIALLSKENALPFLAIIPLFLYYFTDRKLKNILPLTVPYFIAAISFLILRQIVVQATLPVIEPLYNSLLAIQSPSHRISTALLIIGKYLRLLVFPHPLVWDYSYNQIPEAGWTNLHVILSVSICIALLIYALIQIKRRDIFAFGILFFFISLSITANLFVYVASNMSERFLYTPSLGFCIVLFFLIFRTTALKRPNAKNKRQSQEAFKSPLFYFVTLVFVIAYSYKTIERSGDWKDNITLFTAGIRDSPNSAKTHLAYASELSNKAKTEDSTVATQLYREAIEEFKIGLNIYPDDPDGWFNLGFAYFCLNNHDEALKAEERAIATEPRYAKAYNNIGVIRAMRGEIKEALPYFEKAASIDTNYADAYGNVGRCYNLLGEYSKASLYFKRALKLNPFDENINRNMAENNKKLKDISKQP
jgi:protein O-mannosyl-transferase